MTTQWEQAKEDTCPKCKQPTQYLINRDGEHAMVDAERCKRCGWEIRFDGEE